MTLRSKYVVKPSLSHMSFQLALAPGQQLSPLVVYGAEGVNIVAGSRLA